MQWLIIPEESTIEAFSVHSSVREILFRFIRLLYKGLKVVEEMKHIGKV